MLFNFQEEEQEDPQQIVAFPDPQQHSKARRLLQRKTPDKIQFREIKVLKKNHRLQPLGNQEKQQRPQQVQIKSEVKWETFLKIYNPLSAIPKGQLAKFITVIDSSGFCYFAPQYKLLSQTGRVLMQAKGQFSLMSKKFSILVGEQKIGELTSRKPGQLKLTLISKSTAIAVIQVDQQTKVTLSSRGSTCQFHSRQVQQDHRTVLVFGEGQLSVQQGKDDSSMFEIKVGHPLSPMIAMAVVVAICTFL